MGKDGILVGDLEQFAIQRQGVVWVAAGLVPRSNLP